MLPCLRCPGLKSLNLPPSASDSVRLFHRPLCLPLDESGRPISGFIDRFEQLPDAHGSPTEQDRSLAAVEVYFHLMNALVF